MAKLLICGMRRKMMTADVGQVLYKTMSRNAEANVIGAKSCVRINVAVLCVALSRDLLLYIACNADEDLRAYAYP